MSRVEQEQQGFDAARTVYSLCLALENRDLTTLNELRRSISGNDWKAIAEHAVCALVESTRGQRLSLGASAADYFESSIRALVALEALGAPASGMPAET